MTVPKENYLRSFLSVSHLGPSDVQLYLFCTPRSFIDILFLTTRESKNRISLLNERKGTLCREGKIIKLP